MTHHILPQVVLFLMLESAQVLENTSTRILDVPLGCYLSLLELTDGLSSLTNRIASSSLWVNIHDTLNGVADRAEDLVGDGVAAGHLPMGHTGTPLR